MKRTAIVIINFRTPDLTLDCLATLEGEIDPSQDVVIVVDNDSSDGSFEEIQQRISANGWDEWVQLIASGHNGGFSYGNNVGIRAVEAQYYLLLNSDTLVHPEAVAVMRNALEARPEVGLVGPRLEWPDAEPQISCFRYRNPAGELIVAASTAPITNLLQNYNVPLPVDEHPSEPDWASFACIMIRREVLEQVGLMDEGYFMYFEDIDYCRRAQAKGWKLLCDPSARVVHLRGGSSKVKTALAERKRPPRFYYESRARYFAKFYGITGLWFTNLLWGLGRTIEWTRGVCTGRPRLTCEREALDNWIGWRNPMKINRQVPQPAPRLSPGPLGSKLNSQPTN